MFNLFLDIQEVREVGSFKKGIMMTKSNIADLVVILKTLPTIELVMNLGQKIVDDLKLEQKESEFSKQRNKVGWKR